MDLFPYTGELFSAWVNLIRCQGPQTFLKCRTIEIDQQPQWIGRGEGLYMYEPKWLIQTGIKKKFNCHDALPCLATLQDIATFFFCNGGHLGRWIHDC